MYFKQKGYRRYMSNYFIGLDIGGTKVECAIFTRSFEVLARNRVPTGRDRGHTPVMQTIADLILNTCQDAQISFTEVYGIGCGLPGTICPIKQIMLNGNSTIFINRDFRTDLLKLLPSKIKIILANDASCFALAEVSLGVGPLYEKIHNIPINDHIGIGIILGTGVGGGIIINGTILNGRNGGGAEFGHTQLITDGYKCYCGNKGCAETYLSGTAVVRIYREKYNEELTSSEIFNLAERGNPKALTIINQYKKHLASFLANLTNIFDPDYFVLGGGVSTREIIYEDLDNMMHQSIFVPQAKPSIFMHKLGDSAGVFGAAKLL